MVNSGGLDGVSVMGVGFGGESGLLEGETGDSEGGEDLKVGGGEALGAGL